MKEERAGQPPSFSKWIYYINPHHVLATTLPKAVSIPNLESWSYVHGSFFGAAPMMLQDPKWRLILQRLMPHVFLECVKCCMKSRYQVRLDF